MNPIEVTLYCKCGKTRKVSIEPRNQDLNTRCECGSHMYGRACIYQPDEVMPRTRVSKHRIKTYTLGYCNSRTEVYVNKGKVEILFVRDLLSYDPDSDVYLAR